MQIPVLVEKVEGNGFRAREVWPLGQGGLFATEGATREEALDKLRQLIQSRLPSGAELVDLEIGTEAEIQRLKAENAALRAQLEQVTGSAWDKMAGIYKEDPLFDEWQQAIADYRRQVEEDPNIP
jgi:hypothetical protein